MNENTELTRFTGLVYASALRQMGGDTHAAADVTQAVFIVAMQKRGKLPRNERLAGWLLRVTTFCVKNAQRAAVRRSFHERQAMRSETMERESSANEVARVLDEALLKLGTIDREAVVRRYLHGENVRFVAAAVRLTENATHVRVGRALEKLRKILAKRGVVAPATALTMLMLAESAKAVPAAVVEGGGGSSATVISIAKGAAMAMKIAAFKTAAAGVVMTAAIGITAVVVAQRHDVPKVAVAATAPEEVAATQKANESFSAKVQDALQIKRTNADMLTALADAVQNVDMANTREVQPLIQNLVDALLAGPDPDALVNKILPTVEIESSTGAQYKVPQWKWGAYWERSELCDHLWTLANTVDATDAEAARKIARAAVLLVAMNDFQAGSLKLSPMIEEDAFRTLTGMDDERFEKLKSLVAERSKQLKVWSTYTFAAAFGYNRIRAGQISKEAVQKILRRSDAAFREGPPQLGYRWRVLSATWELLNALRLHENEEGQELVRQQFASWRRDFPDKHIDRWIGQALEREGEPPEKLVSAVKMTAHGDVDNEEEAAANAEAEAAAMEKEHGL
ncbi:MAG: sigma-70 family RNA polymerase sigma factor [Phycisphaerales bacterium]|nr:sigma-70 family RNA polymerase sigma factor [Phycisphaerales bacterium]